MVTLMIDYIKYICTQLSIVAMVTLLIDYMKTYTWLSIVAIGNINDWLHWIYMYISIVAMVTLIIDYMECMYMYFVSFLVIWWT